MPEVEHITYSGEYGRRRGQKSIYITERCVFELGESGMELTEIAPGVDLQKDVLVQMDFTPIIERDPRLMNEKIFALGVMGGMVMD